jgi:hypothetical protein
VAVWNYLFQLKAEKGMSMEHAYFSPSASSRWIPCPASLFKTEQIPQKETPIYAHEGIVCHDIAAKCLTSKGKITPDSYVGTVTEGVPMTPELIEGIQMYVDEIYGLAKEYKCTGGKIEEKVTISEHCWGTSDAILWNPDTLLVCDLKMGKGVIVPAENNPQLGIYAVGAAKLLHELYGITPKEIILVIIQPRTVNPIRKHTRTREELAQWFTNKVVPVIGKFKPGVDSGEQCNPGEKQCKWCPIAATCVEAAGKVMTDAQEAMLPFTKANTVQNLDLKTAAEHKANFKFIQQWMKTLDEFIMKSALAGEHVPGFKLVEGRSNRKWKADEKQVVKFLVDLNVKAYKKTLITPPQAEKSMGKKLAKKSDLAKFITKPKGKPTLVPESDTRPEMESTVESEFEEFVEPFKPAPDEVLIVGEDEVSEKLSALQRMKRAALTEDEEPKEEKATLELANGSTVEMVDSDMGVVAGINLVEETATGVNPNTEKIVAIQHPRASKTTLPRRGSKLRGLLDVADGDTTTTQAAGKLGCSEKDITLHLRYLNERHGWGYIIYEDFTFDVYGAV